MDYLSLLRLAIRPTNSHKFLAIDDRQLTRFDIPDLLKEIEGAERKVDELTALANGRKARKAFGVIPRDW